MKKMLIFLALATLAVNAGKKNKAIVLESPKDSFSYAIGLEIATSLEQIKTEVNLPSLFQGITDGSTPESKVQLTPEQATAMKESVFQRLQEAEKAKRDSLATANLAVGIAFLEENSKKEGVITTGSGLQYSVVKLGTGPMASDSSQVRVHYVGTTIEGKVFDSSRERNEPAEFALDRVIPGWSELVKLMPAGSTYKGVLPSDIAYGEYGAGPDIAPNAVLIFEVELLDVLTYPVGSADEGLEKVEAPATTPAPAATPEVKAPATKK